MYIVKNNIYSDIHVRARTKIIYPEHLNRLITVQVYLFFFRKIISSFFSYVNKRTIRVVYSFHFDAIQVKTINTFKTNVCRI